MKKKLHIRSAQIIPLGFLGLIVIGTLLLLLPFATASGHGADFLTALFTATTSVCVTGLVVVDTFSYWSTFGHIVILLLIQLGGLGVVAVASAFMMALHKKFSLRGKLLLRDAFNLNSIDGLRHFLFRVVRGTFIVEGIGALFYMIAFIPKFGLKGVWIALFTAVSAFCNAGIDIIGPDSLIPFQNDPLVLIVTMLLIVLGGLGFVVWFDLSGAFCESVNPKKKIKKRFFARLSEMSKLVLVLTGALILIGAVVVFILEYGNEKTIGGMPVGSKILNSFFQSVTFRTAGFAAVPQGELRAATSLFGDAMMFIGGSPVGTAGGVKTVTFFVAILNVVAFIRDRSETVVFKRRISEALIKKAHAIVAVSFGAAFLGSLLLLATHPGVRLSDALYEMFSATGTVGLTRGLTPQLNIFGRILVIVVMYFGRIGPISMALFFNISRPSDNDIRYADGKYIVG